MKEIKNYQDYKTELKNLKNSYNKVVDVYKNIPIVVKSGWDTAEKGNMYGYCIALHPFSGSVYRKLESVKEYIDEILKKGYDLFSQDCKRFHEFFINLSQNKIKSVQKGKKRILINISEDLVKYGKITDISEAKIEEILKDNKRRCEILDDSVY